MNEQAVARVFDDTARRYDRAYDARGPKGRQLRGRQLAAIDLLGDGPGTFLDAGLGPGRLSLEACRSHWTAVGVDISDQMVAMARDRLLHVDAAVLRASVDRLPFAAKSFDAVVAVGVFGYLADADAFLDEAHRLLRGGGRVIVSIPNTRSVRYAWRSAIWYPAVRFTKARIHTGQPAPVRRSGPVKLRQLQGMLEKRGLTVTALRYVGAGSDAPDGRLGKLRTLLATEIVVLVAKDPSGSPSSGGQPLPG